jgi:O-glycosyl hydrolase
MKEQIPGSPAGRSPLRVFIPAALLAALALAVLLWLLPYAPVHASSYGLRALQRDTIDLSSPRQRMASFGASDCWTMQVIGREWSEASKEAVAKLLFSRTGGIGLSQWRVNLGAGSNQVSIADPWHQTESFERAPGVYDWSRAPGLRWFLRAAKRYGVPHLVAFINSPLARLTVNGLTNAYGLDPMRCNLEPGREAEFARYLGEVVNHFACNPDPAERVFFHALSPLNEPEWEWTSKQEGLPASNADLLRIARAVEKELERRKLKTLLLLPEAGHLKDMVEPNVSSSRRMGSETGAYLPLLAGDENLLRRSANVLAYHSYWSDNEDLISLRVSVCRAAREKGLQLWQSEYCIMEKGRDLGMEAALRLARVIHADLTVAEVSSWSWWLALSRYDFKDGLIYTDYAGPGDPEQIHPAKLLWTLGQWSRYVRPGMVRLVLTGDASRGVPGLMRSAFADKKQVVAVYVNPGPEEVGIRPGFIGGRAPRRSPRLFRTSAAPDENLKEIAGTGARSINLPPRSITTLVWER